jgi:large subunit ribosomal protein L25
MELIDLTGLLRVERGKSEVRALKRSGFVPGVLYGNLPSKENIHLKISRKELEGKVKFPIRSNQLYKFNLNKTVGTSTQDPQSFVVFIKDWQLNPLKPRWWEHLDLYAIDENKKVRVSVPLKFTGTAAGIKQGGILQPIRREVEVEALPRHIPELIGVIVDELMIGQSIHVNDLTPPENCAFYAPTNFALVTVAAPAEEEEKPEPIAAAGAETAPAAEAGESAEKAPEEDKEKKEKKKE